MPHTHIGLCEVLRLSWLEALPYKLRTSALCNTHRLAAAHPSPQQENFPRNHGRVESAFSGLPVIAGRQPI